MEADTISKNRRNLKSQKSRENFLRKICFAILGLVFIAPYDKKENPQTIDLKKETISAKWNVNTDSNYKSFEFNTDGNYVIAKSSITKSTDNQTVFFGSYDIIDNTTILLSDLGELKISEFSNNSIRFTVSFDKNFIINASKQEEIQKSSNTELLCRTWKLVSIEGKDLGDFIVLFSKAGTYLVNFIDENEEPLTVLGVWTWCNSAENKLAFTIEEELNCDGIQVIKDIQLTTNSFIGTNMENGKPEIIVMKPANSD